MRQISLRHLRFFVTVAETGSFTAAANRLSHTQSSLTSTIQQLEEALGLKLFDRTTRRVELTEEAIRFKSTAHRIINDFDSALGDMKSIANGQRGHVSIAAPQSLIVQVLSPALAKYRKAFPEVTVSLIDGGSSRIEKLVMDGEVDFGLASPLTNSSELDYAPVLSDPFGVLMPRGHPLTALGRPVEWPDLQGHESIILTKDTGIGALLESHPELGLNRHSSIQDSASSTTALFAMLAMGGRISVVPALAAKATPDYDFVFQIVSKPAITREICILTRRARSLSINASRVIDVLTDSLHDIDLNGASVIFNDEQHGDDWPRQLVGARSAKDWSEFRAA